MNSEIEKTLYKKAKRYVSILRIVPFVKMIAVCNNLAFSKVDEHSDIDLFIVAERGRLFIVRTLVTFILQVLGVRRHGNLVAGRFCLSFFVDDTSYDLSKIAIDDDIYLAYWCKTLVPLVDRGGAEEFVLNNQWIADYFEKPFDFKLDNSRILKDRFVFGRALLRVLFFWKWGDFVEGVLSSWQIKRARAKAARASKGADLVISDHMLKFHNIDRRRYYRDKYFETYGKNALLTDQRFARL